ncbi:MAG TPA: type II toxin-antitoxin system CcdA family antitoxin [Kofleriaceae bacterium]|nr:type II toxin-antitoxin system CcdA family antitoxin [Kofleriaceae bacterium]
MRNPPHDPKAAKRTVSLTINSEVYAQAKQLGINASQVAEEALIHQVARVRAEQVQAEIRKDLAAASSYMARHGSFADLVREHYRTDAGPDEE